MSSNPDVSTEELAGRANRGDSTEPAAAGAGRYAEGAPVADRDMAVDPGSTVPVQPGFTEAGSVQPESDRQAWGVQQARVESGETDRPIGGEVGGVNADDDRSDVSLLDTGDADRFRARWNDVQTRFVDDPREAVGTADGLVAELMQTLAANFAEHKSRLEAQWSRGGDADTEELRQALHRYRSFFNRLLQSS